MRLEDFEEWSEVESSSWELNKQLEDPVEEVNEIMGLLKAAIEAAAPLAPAMKDEEGVTSPASLEVVESSDL